MKINQIYTFSHLRNFSYILETYEGIFCVDPYYSKQVIDFLGERKLYAIINTHEHGDHTRGNHELVKFYNCQVWAHLNAKGKIEGVSRFLAKGEEISLGSGWQMEIMDTPGHTFAHLCLLIKKNQNPFAVITGDTLFNAGVGNCYNGGDPKVLFSTIYEQFINLPGNVILYPGHEYLESNLRFCLDREPGNKDAKKLFEEVTNLNMETDFFSTNMEIEKKINPFMRLDRPEIIKNLKGNYKDPEKVFLRLRDLRDKW